MVTAFLQDYLLVIQKEKGYNIIDLDQWGVYF